MVVLQRGNDFETYAPAKLNLHLEVLAKRNDGFHEIETLMVVVSVYDTLRLRSLPENELRLACRWASGLAARHGSQLGDLPNGEENLVHRALALLKSSAQVSMGAEVELIKRIPSQAGLGGASSNAAAALLLANQAWHLGWSLEQLAALAAQLGSDIPFFLYGRSAICRGRGERIEPVGKIAPLPVVVARPAEGLSTPQVYRACRVPLEPVSVQPLLQALRAGSASQAARQMVNRLQAPAADLSPAIGRLRAAFGATDCLGSQMSGSGSSYFGVYRNLREARRNAARLSASGKDWVAFGWAGAC